MNIYVAHAAQQPPWRNWLARSAVNRKVDGSSPSGGANFISSLSDLSLSYSTIKEYPNLNRRSLT